MRGRGAPLRCADVPSRLPRGATRLLISLFLGQVAVAMQVTAAGIQVYDITNSTLSLGLLGLAEFLPNLALAPLTGTLADRFDRRRVAGAGVGLEALCALGLAAYAATDPTSIAPILGIVIVFGVARAVTAPASRSIPADISRPEQLPHLVPRASAMWQIASVVGPATTGFLYAAAVPLPYLVAAASMLAGAVTLQFVPLPARARAAVAAGREVLRAAWEGVRFVRHSQLLLGAIALDLFAVLFGGAIALIPAIAEERLGAGEVGIGWLRAAVGIGSGATTLVLAVRPVRRHVGRVLLLAVGIFGALTVVFGLTTSYAVACVAMLGLSAADAISVFVRATLVPLVTPPAMRGRVLAVENVFIGASNELGAFESGVLGALIGAAAAVASGGVAVLAIVALWWHRFPALRDVDTFAEVTPVEALPSDAAAPAPPG